jgi:3-phenylpropionate/trans-cinnamate dioxygenase ferredoxin subunit
MSFVAIAQVDQIPAGTMKSLIVKGNTILVVNIKGDFYAIGNKCTHFGGDLAKGKLEGSIVTCPRHGSQFDVISGNLVKGPATKGEPVYKVRIEGQSVEVEI